MSPCEEFTKRARCRGGYAQVSVAGKTTLAHRAAWVAANGPIPSGLHVLHRCDNPPCVNIEHLFLGTHQDNMDDKKSKGRHGAMPLRKLSPEEMREVRCLIKLGISSIWIGILYKVTGRHVRRQRSL